jgi:hypothetical protein
MNYDKYKNTLPYPNKKDFTITYFYSQGKVVGQANKNNADEMKRLNLAYPKAVTENVTDEVAYKAKEAEYREETRHLNALFIKDLFEDNGVPDDEFSQKLYSLAEQRGHHAGYSEIASNFSDLAPLHDLAMKVFGK